MVCEASLRRFGVDGASIRTAFKLMGWIDGTISTTQPRDLESRLHALLPSFANITNIPSLTRSIDQAITAVTADLTSRKRFDLACTYLTYVDTASHDYWGGFEPPVVSFRSTARDKTVRTAISKLPQSKDLLAQAYEGSDQTLGMLMDRSTYVVVFSDHGFGSSAIDYLYLQFRLDDFLHNFSRESGLPLPATSEVTGYSQVFLLWLPQTVEGRTYASKLVDCLKKSNYLPHGSPMFSDISVEDRNGRITVNFIQQQPTPIFINGVTVNGSVHSVMDFFDLSTLQGSHNGNGILGLWGPGIRKIHIEEAYTPDVAPTVLSLLGLPTARDMDGRVLTEAFRDGELESHPARTVRTFGNAGNIWLRAAQAMYWRRAFTQLLKWVAAAAAHPGKFLN